MKHTYPAYYAQFRCTAGACPDNCCQGWEVVVDDDAYRLYRSVEGAFGRALEEAMTVDADGDRIIAMRDGRCPFWNAERLCEVELRLGHDAPCATCRTFPRITQDYEAFAEHDLSLACPEAVRLLLATGDGRLREEGAMGPWPPEYDGALMEALLVYRQELLAILDGTKQPFRRKLETCLAYAHWVERQIDGVGPGAVPQAAVCKADAAGILRFYAGLEILTEEWRLLLERVQRKPPDDGDYAALEAHTAQWERELSRWGAYFIRRYWLQAVADGDVVGKVKKLLAAWALIRGLLAASAREGQQATLERFARLAQLYAKEVEHDGDNQAALEDAFFDLPCFSDGALLALL